MISKLILNLHKYNLTLNITTTKIKNKAQIKR